MPDDFLQQVGQNAPAVAGGGAVGGGAIIAALKVFRVFASPQDIELAEARMEAKISGIEAKFAEKYVTQDMLKHFDEKLDKIQDRIDQLFDKK